MKLVLDDGKRKMWEMGLSCIRVEYSFKCCVLDLCGSGMQKNEMT